MRIALVSEGSSDRMLLPALRWLLESLDGDRPHELVPIDLRGMRSPPDSLEDKIAYVGSSAVWNLVLVHRDSDARDPEPRYREIRQAEATASIGIPIVPVVPIRATEAWLLFDIRAVRKASGAPNSTAALTLPKLSEIERRADPKQILYDALRTASETRGRRRASFRPEPRCHVVATEVRNWKPLRRLSSFRRLRDDLESALSLVPDS